MQLFLNEITKIYYSFTYRYYKHHMNPLHIELLYVDTPNDHYLVGLNYYELHTVYWQQLGDIFYIYMLI